MQSLYTFFQQFIKGEGRSAILKKNIFYSIIIKGVSIVVSFALVPLTIGYVSEELYGVWLTLSSLLTWISFMDIGFSQGLKNRLNEALAVNDYERGRKLVSTTYFMMTLIFVPLGIIIQFLIPLVDWCSFLNISTIYENDILLSLHVLMAFCCIQMIVNVLVSVLAAFQRVAVSNSFLVIGNVISLFLIFALTKFCPPSLLVLCFAFSLMPILVTLLASIILFRGRYRQVAPSLHEIDMSLTKDLFGLGYKFFLINIQAVVLYQTTNVLISNVSSPVWVTSYNIAYRYLNVAIMLYAIIVGPLWPAYTDAYAKKDYLWMNNIYNKMRKMALYSSFVCVTMAIIAPFVYHIWVGKQVEVPAEMTWIVMAYIVLLCWNQLVSTFIAGIGKLKVHLYVAITGMCVHIPLAYFLSSYIGPYGVIASMIVINLIYVTIYSSQIRMILNQTARGIWNK